MNTSNQKKELNKKSGNIRMPKQRKNQVRQREQPAKAIIKNTNYGGKQSAVLVDHSGKLSGRVPKVKKGMSDELLAQCSLPKLTSFPVNAPHLITAVQVQIAALCVRYPALFENSAGRAPSIVALYLLGALIQRGVDLGMVTGAPASFFNRVSLAIPCAWAKFIEYYWTSPRAKFVRYCNFDDVDFFATTTGIVPASSPTPLNVCDALFPKLVVGVMSGIELSGPPPIPWVGVSITTLSTTVSLSNFSQQSYVNDIGPVFTSLNIPTVPLDAIPSYAPDESAFCIPLFPPGYTFPTGSFYTIADSVTCWTCASPYYRGDLAQVLSVGNIAAVGLGDYDHIECAPMATLEVSRSGFRSSTSNANVNNGPILHPSVTIEMFEKFFTLPKSYVKGPMFGGKTRKQKGGLEVGDGIKITGFCRIKATPVDFGSYVDLFNKCFQQLLLQVKNNSPTLTGSTNSFGLDFTVLYPSLFIGAVEALIRKVQRCTVSPLLQIGGFQCWNSTNTTYALQAMLVSGISSNTPLWTPLVNFLDSIGYVKTGNTLVVPYLNVAPPSPSGAFSYLTSPTVAFSAVEASPFWFWANSITSTGDYPSKATDGNIIGFSYPANATYYPRISSSASGTNFYSQQIGSVSLNPNLQLVPGGGFDPPYNFGTMLSGVVVSGFYGASMFVTPNIAAEIATGFSSVSKIAGSNIPLANPSSVISGNLGMTNTVYYGVVSKNSQGIFPFFNSNFYYIDICRGVQIYSVVPLDLKHIGSAITLPGVGKAIYYADIVQSAANLSIDYLAFPHMYSLSISDSTTSPFVTALVEELFNATSGTNVKFDKNVVNLHGSNAPFLMTNAEYERSRLNCLWSALTGYLVKEGGNILLNSKAQVVSKAALGAVPYSGAVIDIAFSLLKTTSSMLGDQLIQRSKFKMVKKSD